MKATIIVPVYNVEKYLSRCLDSLVHQTISDYEILCANDCSPDNSDLILSEYQEKYPSRIRVLNNECNLGLGRTRERALKHVCGEYVFFVDSDDYVAPDYIETYLQAAENGDYDIIAGGFIRDIDGKLKRHRISNSVWSTTTYAIAWAKLFKKSFIEENKLGFTGVPCGEDIYFSLCAFYCNAKVKIIPYEGYYYYFNRQSITGSMSYKKNHEQIMAEMFDLFLESHDLSKLPKSRFDVIEYTYLANMINALVVFNRGCGPELMKSKYDFVFSHARKYFPNYLKNPHIGILKPKGQTLKIRLGVGVLLGLQKFHLDWPAYYIISKL